MSRRGAIAAVLASLVVVLGAGCDSGSEPPSTAETAASPTTTGTTEAPTTETQTTATPTTETPTTAPPTTETPTTETPTTTAPTDTGLTPGTPTSTTPASTTSTTPPEPRYALGPTRRCLVRAGMQVGKVRGEDARLQALRDLAQHTSLEIRDGGDVVGLAITDVELLRELLAVPNDPYRIETQGNALLMFKPGVRDLSRRVRDCLRA